MSYAYGGVLALSEPGVNWTDLHSSIFTARRHSLTGKLGGTIPSTHTRWSTSYKWTSGANALTPVDYLDPSAAQADPYLEIFIRQPIPGTAFLPGHMEALIEIRNLLAQGYVPVAGSNGRTLYLVQAPRSFRGGLAVTF